MTPAPIRWSTVLVIVALSLAAWGVVLLVGYGIYWAMTGGGA